MTTYDCFMFRGGGTELDILEMRLTEFQDTPDVQHILVEAETDFQNNPKPLWYADHRERFAPWKDRITHIIATGLPGGIDPPGAPPDTSGRASKSWARERAQRNWCAEGLKDAAPDDIVLVGDVDEIPALPLGDISGTPGYVHHVRHMTFAVDWENPVRQLCTMVVRRKQIITFARMRDYKYVIPKRDGGWHFSWLGGPDAIEAKNLACAHTEHKEKVAEGNAAGLLYERGWCPWMADGVQLAPVEVDETWPRWIRERQCPEIWFRPRENETEPT